MKRIILDLAVTLDGFIEGPNGEIDWCIMDEEMGFDNFLGSIDTIFYGRVSYDMWGNYTPEATAPAAEKDLWSTVHSKQKYVFSSTPKKVNNATFLSGDIEANVDRIKQQGGKNIWLYGGAKLITTFIKLNLIDEYRLSVHPTVLGAGKPLFANLDKRLELELLHTRKFSSGVVQLIYGPKN